MTERRPPDNYCGEAQPWDVQTDTRIGHPMEQTRPVWAVAFRDCTRMAIAGQARRRQELTCRGKDLRNLQDQWPGQVNKWFQYERQRKRQCPVKQ